VAKTAKTKAATTRAGTAKRPTTKRPTTNVRAPAAGEALKAEIVEGGTAAARRCEELLGEIARRKQRIAEDFYDIGVALREIKKKKLYAALGHRSLADLLSARGVLGKSQAAKLIAIVDHLPRSKAIGEGIEKSYALVRLAAATPALDTAVEVAAEGVVVRGKRAAVGELSGRGVSKLARKVRSVHAKRDPARSEANASVRKLERALRAAGLDAEVALRGKGPSANVSVVIALSSLPKLLSLVARAVK
jgi:hypothetical protein